MDAAHVVADSGAGLLAAGAGVLVARRGSRERACATTTVWRTWTRRRCRRSTGPCRRCPVRSAPAPPAPSGRGTAESRRWRRARAARPRRCPAWVLAASRRVLAQLRDAARSPDLHAARGPRVGVARCPLARRVLGDAGAADGWLLGCAPRDAVGRGRGRCVCSFRASTSRRSPRAPALPLRRALVDAVVGKKVQPRLGGGARPARASGGFAPRRSALPEMRVSRGRDGARRRGALSGAAPCSRGLPAARRWLVSRGRCSRGRGRARSWRSRRCASTGRGGSWCWRAGCG